MIVVLLFPLQFPVHNGLRNKVVRVVFVYPKCEGGGSVHLELCLPIDSINALGNDQEVHGCFVIKNFNFDLKMINLDLK